MWLPELRRFGVHMLAEAGWTSIKPMTSCALLTIKVRPDEKVGFAWRDRRLCGLFAVNAGMERDTYNLAFEGEGFVSYCDRRMSHVEIDHCSNGEDQQSEDQPYQESHANHVLN